MNNTETLKQLQTNGFFKVKSHIISNYSFAYSTKLFAFPSFDIIKNFGGQITTLVQLSNFNTSNIDYYMDIIKEEFFKSEFVILPGVQSLLNANGLSLIGFYTDGIAFYLCVSIKPKLVDDLTANFLLKAYNELNENLKLRVDLLRQKDKISLDTFSVVEKELLNLKQINIPFLTTINRREYVKYIQEYYNNNIQILLKLVDYIFKIINKKSVTKLKGTNNIRALSHFNIVNSYQYCMCQRLNKESLIYYNINEGFGTIKNDNEKSFLIPTTLLQDNNLNKKIEPQYDIVTSSNLKNYSLNNFSTKEQFLELIKKRAEMLKLKPNLVYEIKQFKPVKLFIG